MRCCSMLLEADGHHLERLLLSASSPFFCWASFAPSDWLEESHDVHERGTTSECWYEDSAFSAHLFLPPPAPGRRTNSSVVGTYTETPPLPHTWRSEDLVVNLIVCNELDTSVSPRVGQDMRLGYIASTITQNAVSALLPTPPPPYFSAPCCPITGHHTMDIGPEFHSVSRTGFTAKRRQLEDLAPNVGPCEVFISRVGSLDETASLSSSTSCVARLRGGLETTYTLTYPNRVRGYRVVLPPSLRHYRVHPMRTYVAIGGIFRVTSP